MRLFICEFVQESNSFNPVLAQYEDFANDGIFEGDALVTAGYKAGATVGGMLEVIKEAGHTAIGGIRMRAKSGGPIARSVVDHFIEKTVTALKSIDPPDALLISLHGASLSDTSDDVCGDILIILRQLIGEKIPIVATCDLHGNITQNMISSADIICGYQSYPHLDHANTGKRAAKLALQVLEGKKIKTAFAFVPMMAPAHSYTTNDGPLSKLMEKGQCLIAENKIADFSVFQVQPWLNVNKIRSAIAIVAEDEVYAQKLCNEFVADEFALRHSLLGEKLFTVEQVIQKALENTTGKPVVLVDSADSPNAGAVGDCATIIEKLYPYKDQLSIAVAVNDVPAVEQAFKLGVGAVADFTLGATLAPKLSAPVFVKNCTVKSLHLGDITLGGPAERGQLRNFGKSAVLTCGKLQILLTEKGQNNGDKQFYRGFGIEPTLCDLVCVKACTSFRAGYEPISAEICNTTTPGAAGPELLKLPFDKLPSPFFPFNEIQESDIVKAKIYR